MHLTFKNPITIPSSSTTLRNGGWTLTQKLLEIKFTSNTCFYILFIQESYESHLSSTTPWKGYLGWSLNIDMHLIKTTTDQKSFGQVKKKTTINFSFYQKKRKSSTHTKSQKQKKCPRHLSILTLRCLGSETCKKNRNRNSRKLLHLTRTIRVNQKKKVSFTFNIPLNVAFFLSLQNFLYQSQRL